MRTKIILLLSLLAISAFAQPNITSVSGNFEDGETIQITGTDFGPAPTIVSWDNFENGSNGSNLGSPIYGPTWTFQHPSQNTPYPHYSQEQAYSGTKSAKVTWKEPGWGGSSINAFGWSSQGPYNHLYLSYYRYHDPSQNEPPPTMNHKQLYTFGPVNSPTRNEQQQFMPFMIPAGNASFATMLQDTPAAIWYWSNSPRYNTSNYQWGRWEFWLDYEDSASQNNGLFKIWYNLQLKRNPTGLNMCNIEGGQYVEDIRIGHMFQGYSTLSYVRSFFDDIYIATTQARVELGDSESYELCSSREIQPATNWTSTSVELPLRTVNFSSQQNVWVYVLDENGTQSLGFPITLGDIQNQEGPGIPGQPERQ